MTLPTTARPLWGRFILLVASIVVLDQVTKAWIAGELGGGRSMSFLGGLVRLVHHQNDGALFGLFGGNAPLFGALSLVVIGLIVAFHARSGRSPYMTLTLGLLLGGAIGNALDRLRLGYVIDFVDAGIGSLRWFTFNVADACISASIVLLFATAIWPSLAGSGRPTQPAAPAPDDAPGDAAGDGDG